MGLKLYLVYFYIFNLLLTLPTCVIKKVYWPIYSHTAYHHKKYFLTSIPLLSSSLLFSLDFLFSFFQFRTFFLFNLTFCVPSYIKHRPFWLLTEMNLDLALPCIFIFIRCQNCIFGRFYYYYSFRSWRKIFHDFFEVAQSQEVQFSILHEIVLDSFF